MSPTPVPPFARIANELRAQISSGALAPGQRVPSTREITREWGVAMATATKVLTALSQEGLVRSVPGVGTIVVGLQAGSGQDSTSQATADQHTAGDTGPPAASAALKSVRSRPTTSPTATLIVTTAIAIADAEGLAAVSMRRVAAELGVATMSLYRHVADKDDLVLRMMDAVLRERELAPSPAGPWRDSLETAGRMLWATFRRHTWLAPALSLTRPQPIVGGMAYAEWVLAALEGTGLGPTAMLTTHLTLFNYVRGTAMNLDLEAEAVAETGLSSRAWIARQEDAVQAAVATGALPTFERVDTAEFNVDLGELFEFGLQRLLDGLSLMIKTGSR
ncbi:TetR/AcrR family transcriptional regulator C-terminal domain-containing protein [Leifsonia kafniensis]